MRIQRRDSARGILEFKTMPDHEVVSPLAIRAEILLEVCRRPCLDVTDRRAETVADLQQALVRSAIPGPVRYRPGREERDPKARMRGVAAMGAGSVANRSDRT